MTLEEAARAAKLTDPDLLKIAKPELSAEAAVTDLQKRFPTAFGTKLPEPLKFYKDMTPAEQKAWKHKHQIGGTR